MESESLHRLIQADARNLSFFPDGSVHLAVTSPPYWTLKRYNEGANQLGHVTDYEEFLNDLCKVWKEIYRLLGARRPARLCSRRCLSLASKQ
jgi:modification methylase